MNTFLIVGFALAWLAIIPVALLGWQLVRQNGRILLRLEELEKRLDEMEFGGDEGTQGLPLGSDAPDFELPDLSGQRKSLAQFRGRSVLLIFFNPDCGFCREMMPKLAAVAAGFQPAVEGGILPPGTGISLAESQESSKASPPVANNSAGLEAQLNGGPGGPPPQLLILTTGDAEKNREFFAGHRVGCPVLLQNDGEVAKAYQAHGTPSGYLISAEGRIASPLAMGADALLALATDPRSSRGNEAQTSSHPPSTLNSQPGDGHLLSPALSSNGREGENAGAARFGNRSLAHSKIKRDGLKAGTPAPDFRLPRLDGGGDLSLEELRGRRVLLVFSSPGCGPCNVLAPELEKFHREQRATDRPLTLTLSPEEERESAKSVAVVMISKGEPKENRAKVKEHDLSFPIVLQQQWEISRRYAMFATPVAYLIDERGVIAHDVAVGTDQIRALMSRVASSAIEETETSFVLNSASNT
ncbi:MAG TPA: redoxin domain-containing protein [Verrucomicrobiae bacterium]|nr:redoxin domain-containing protein [Verrucomicrobiae bacterium]